MNLRRIRGDEAVSGGFPFINVFGSWFIAYSSSSNKFDMDDKEEKSASVKLFQYWIRLPSILALFTA